MLQASDFDFAPIIAPNSAQGDCVPDGAMVRARLGCPVKVRAAPWHERRMGFGDVKAQVCREFGVDSTILLSDDRHRPIAYTRQALMFWSRALCRFFDGRVLSFPALAAKMGGLDHSTIMHGVAASRARWIEGKDADFCAHMDALALHFGEVADYA
jgi:Bacterial dnaA protein helix-turn-helix